MLSRVLRRAGATVALAMAAFVFPASAGMVQWDFDGDLAPSTAGSDLIEEAAAPETIPVVDFVTQAIGGADADVAAFSRGTYFRMMHGLPANGGGVYVNQYTLVMDVMFPDTVTSGWAALLQTNSGNSNDGDWFVKSGAGVGISGNYPGWVADGEWHRLALVVDLVAGTFTSYIDGAQTMQNTGEALDGRFSLGADALLFADESSENSAGFVNSVQLRDEALTADEIAALGGPDADGIPIPSNPRDCEFRSFSASYDPGTNTVTGSWSLLPLDEGFRVFEGERQIGSDLPPNATSFTDPEPPVDGIDVTYRLECISSGGVDQECSSAPIQTFACPSGLSCTKAEDEAEVAISWTAAVNTSATGYEIRRNGSSIATVPATTTTYVDSTPPGPGTYAYLVTPQGLGPAVCGASLSCSAAILGDGLLLFDDFESYATDDDLAAAGWEIQEVNFPSETGAFWTLTNPGRRGNPPTANGTPSTGKFLVSDSDASSGDDHQGSGMSHDILSPPFDATGQSQVWLHMDCSAILNNNGEVVFDVDVTVDDGETWTNVFRRVAPGRSLEPLPLADIPEDMPGGPQVGNADGVYGPLDIDISDAAADEPSVRIRFRQFEPSDDWWIAVDNVRVDATPAVGGSRILLASDFSEGFSDGWDVESQVDSLAPWSESDPCLLSLLNSNGGLFPDAFEGRGLHHFDSSFAMIALDELACMGAEQNDLLLAPAIDCGKAANVWLHVKSAIRITDAVAEILLSTDGGMTFDAESPVFTYNASDDSLVRDAGNAEVVYNELVLEVPEAAGEDDVVFAFHYLNPTAQAGFWAIDDFKVTVEDSTELSLFHRGDANDDGQINITDGIYVLNYLFLGGDAPTCLEAANPNDDADINITDGIHILNYLFLGGPAPAAPGPVESPCGRDPESSPTDLGCEAYESC